MNQYTLKHKWLFFVPIIGMIYIIHLATKIGFLTKLSNLNGWEIIGASALHAFTIVSILSFDVILKSL